MKFVAGEICKIPRNVFRGVNVHIYFMLGSESSGHQEATVGTCVSPPNDAGAKWPIRKSCGLKMAKLKISQKCVIRKRERDGIVSYDVIGL